MHQSPRVCLPAVCCLAGGSLLCASLLCTPASRSARRLRRSSGARQRRQRSGRSKATCCRRATPRCSGGWRHSSRRVGSDAALLQWGPMYPAIESEMIAGCAVQGLRLFHTVHLCMRKLTAVLAASGRRCGRAQRRRPGAVAGRVVAGGRAGTYVGSAHHDLEVVGRPTQRDAVDQRPGHVAAAARAGMEG